MKNTPTKINLDDLSIGLYSIHLENKNYRINRVMRTLMMRSDFVDFLKKMESGGLKEQDVKRYDNKNVKLWEIDFEVSYKITRDYLEKVARSRFFEEKSSDWKDSFFNIAQTLLEQTYLDGYVNHKNKNTLFGGLVIFDNSLNYPNITKNFFNKNLFWKIFVDAFYTDSEKIIEKYGDHPSHITIGGNRFDENHKKAGLKPTEPKICQLVFDDTTEKQELIDYINKSWDGIEGSLKAWRPDREEKRITASANFLRDVDIYNKYQEYKDEGYKNPDVKVYSWLKNESEYKIEVEPNTIRKIVSLLKSEQEDINTEK